MKHPPVRTRTAELMRGLGALAVLVVLLAGVPAGLVAVGGSPLPHALPTWDQISATLTQPDTGNTLFLTTIKVIGWAAWFLFTAVTFIEAISYRKGRSAQRLPRPIRPMQHLARDLVAMIALMVSTAAPLAGSTTVPLTHQTAVASDQPARPTTAAANSPAIDESSTNQQRPVLLPATRPADAQRPHPWRMHIIKRGDTLWAIARHSYGTGTKYPAIFNASKDLDQPHGLPHLTDPDHIYPGQRIKIPQAGGNSMHSARPRPRPPGDTQHPRPAPPTTTAPPPGQSSPPARVAPTPVPANPSPPSSTSAPASPPASATAPAPTGAPRPTSHPAPTSGTATPTRPSTAPPAPTEPSGTQPPTATTPSGPPASDEHHPGAPVTVTLPTGAYVGLGLAAAISIALAATRLHRRRRRTHVEEWPDQAAPDPAPTPPTSVAKVRKTHLDTFTDRGEPIPTDADLVAADIITPAPTQITAGVRDGQNLTIALSGLSLGLTGPGAPDVVRAIVTELLARSHRYRVELVIAEPDAAALFAGSGIEIAELADAVPGLIIRPSLGAAIAYLEAEFVHRARLMQTTDEPDVPALRTADPGEPLPALILIATTATTSQALQAILTLGRRYCVGGVLLGNWAAGTTLHVSGDGTVTRADGTEAGTWTGARLFHLTAADAGGMLQVIRTASGAPEPDTPAPMTAPGHNATGRNATDPRQTGQRDAGHGDPPRPARPPAVSADNGASTAPRPEAGSTSAEQPRPVQLHLLGRIRIEAAGKPLATGVRRITRDLLTYLSLNPGGITREQGIDALLPDHDLDAGSTMFHTAINNARKTLRAATGLHEPMFITHIGGSYRLDPRLIDVDLWRLQTALDQAQHADSDTARIQALRPVPDLYPAELAEDITSEWAETARERLRRHTTDAIAHLARLTQTDHPDQALAALEQAIDHDPYAEPLYRAVMRLQAQLGRTDAVRRTYQLLTNQLADLDAEPSNQTHQLLLELLHSTPAGAPKRKPPGESPPTAASRPPHKPNGAGATVRPLHPHDRP